MNEYIKYLTELIPEKDSLKLAKDEAKNIIEPIRYRSVARYIRNL